MYNFQPGSSPLKAPMEPKSPLFITPGFGLSISNDGKLQIDSTGRHFWADTHTFAKPIVFSSEQKIPITSLQSADLKPGGVLVFGSKGWEVVVSAAPGYVLTSSGGKAVWSSIDLNAGVGVLDVKRGGIGLKTVSQGDLLVGGSLNTFSVLPIGSAGSVLISDGQKPYWGALQGEIGGMGTLGALAVFDSPKRIAASQITVHGGEVAITGNPASIRLKAKGREAWVELDQDEFEIACGTSRIVLNESGVVIEYEGGRLHLHDGVMDGFRVPVSDIDGVIPIARGGTGTDAFEHGGLVFVKSNSRLATLSTKGADGKVLGVVRGSLEWVSPTSDVRAMSTRSPDLRLVVPMAETRRSPLEGSLERVGGELYYVDAKKIRRRLMLEDFEFKGTSANVRGIVSLANGGTNNDLSAVNAGSLLVAGKSRIETIPQGDRGLALFSAGYDKAPIWASVVRSVASGDGLSASTNLYGDVLLTLDPDILFSKASTGGFANGLKSSDSVVIAPKSGVHLRLARTVMPATTQDGDIWFDGQEVYVKAHGATMALGSSVKPEPQMVYAVLASGVSPWSLYQHQFLVPYGPDGVTACQWAVKRLDLRCATAGNDGEARLTLNCNEAPIIEAPLAIVRGEHSGSTTRFVASAVRSGDVITTACLQDGGSDFWSVFLTLVRLI